MKLFVLPVLFLFVAALNGGEENFPQIRQKRSKANEPIAIHRFEDKNNVCYVAESKIYGGNVSISGTSIAISCIPAHWTGATFTGSGR